MYTIYLGLGTNLGDRLSNLERAITGLERAMHITAVSPIYDTKAWGLADQPDFLNMCVSAESTLPPFPLLDFIKTLEVRLGRQPAVHWGPRVIDIDILIYVELVVRSQRLDVPHGGLADRATVLVPLADIAPDLLHPLTGDTISDLLKRVDVAGVRPYLAP